MKNKDNNGQSSIEERPMSFFQIQVIFLCSIINILDGFDVTAIAFTAANISNELHIAPSELGIIFSASLVGMSLGAIFIAPIADDIGRRKIILLALAVITFGMLSSAMSDGFYSLVLTRLVTGVGIGAMLASLNTMVSEYSSSKRRNLSIGFMHIGYPIGAAIGGLVAVGVIESHGWQMVFIIGGVLTLLMLPIAYFFLPESIDFLAMRQPKGALNDINGVLKKMHAPVIKELPEIKSNSIKGNKISVILEGENFRRTMLLWAGFFSIMMSFYFLISWTPKILIDSGMHTSQGITAGMILSIGGAIGVILLGILSAKFSLVRLIITYAIGASIGTLVFSLIDVNMSGLFLVILAIGFFMNGTMVGLYSVVAQLYPPEIRNTGVGWAIGIGRFGAIMGPYLGGVMIHSNWTRFEFVSIMGVPFLLVALTVYLLKFDRAQKQY